MFRENYPNTAQRIIDTDTSLTCRACGLYINQLPILDEQKKSNIFWVGLSAVRITEEEVRQPLSSNTRTGALIREIEKPFTNTVAFYKTNVVKCLPLKADKIRYPLKYEIDKCFPNLEWEIEKLRPSLVFLLGKQVGTFIFEKFSLGNVSFNEYYKYDSSIINNIRYIPIHHPSYVLVYKRKCINNYIRCIRSIIELSTNNTTINKTLCSSF